MEDKSISMSVNDEVSTEPLDEKAVEILDEIQADEMKAEMEEELASVDFGNSNEVSAKFEDIVNEQKQNFLRLAADYDNFRKRTVKEKLETYSNAAADTLTEILPILDILERSAEAECSDENYKKGVEMILSQFKNTLAKLGVEEINALGEPFDPRFHNAVKNQPSEDFPEDSVCQVFQKGYKYKDKVLRPSMVAVVN